MKVLIIEDNVELASGLVRYLGHKDITCEVALDGKEGFHKALSKHYDICILDIELPSMNGLEVCKALREKEQNIPIIMLTSRGSNNDTITGLGVGADDYLVKPFDYEVLVSRLQALGRRSFMNKSTGVIEHKKFFIDTDKKTVVDTTNHTQIHFSHLEFELLEYFIRNKGKIISREELYNKVWGEFDGDIMFSKTVDVYIGYLRKKLGKEIIETKKGYGYILNS